MTEVTAGENERIAEIIEDENGKYVTECEHFKKK